MLYCSPVFSFAACWWCSTLLTFIASHSIRELQLWVKLSHLFDHFSRLKCQLVCWGKAQTLEGQRNNECEATNAMGNTTTPAFKNPNWNSTEGKHVRS